MKSSCMFLLPIWLKILLVLTTFYLLDSKFFGEFHTFVDLQLNLEMGLHWRNKNNIDFVSFLTEFQLGVIINILLFYNNKESRIQ